jgi:plasmid stabilization system protein ParE
VRVTWSLRARRELREQRRFIAREQPAAALRVSRHIGAAAERLGTYPYLGRTASWDARRRIRELPVANTPFVVMYAVDEVDNAIVILRVVHGARQRGSE